MGMMYARRLLKGCAYTATKDRRDVTHVDLRIGKHGEGMRFTSDVAECNFLIGSVSCKTSFAGYSYLVPVKICADSSS